VLFGFLVCLFFLVCSVAVLGCSYPKPTSCSMTGTGVPCLRDISYATDIVALAWWPGQGVAGQTHFVFVVDVALLCVVSEEFAGTGLVPLWGRDGP
jgi:hypothetical protein